MSPKASYSTFVFGSPTPVGLAFLERRLLRGLYGLVEVEASYFRSKEPMTNGESKIEGAGVSMEPGLRWVANPGALVEVGMTHTLFFALSRATNDYTWTADVINPPKPTKSSSWALGTATAIVAERELMPQLWLRVASTMLRATTSKSTTEGELAGMDVNGDSRTWMLRFVFEPSLTLRLAF